MDGKMRIIYYMVLIEMHCVIIQGAIVETVFQKLSGDRPIPFSCARNTARYTTFTGFEIDASNKCTSLGWDWETASRIQNESMYFEKKHLVQIYYKPMNLEGKLPLPVVFRTGSTIDMYINVSDNNFTYGYIQLVNTLNESLQATFGSGLTVMINLDLRPIQNTVTVKSYHDGWNNHNSISPYPFPTGSRHKVSFKALASDIQILFNDKEVDRYKHSIQPEHARMFKFHNLGMQLLQIEFVSQ